MESYIETEAAPSVGFFKIVNRQSSISLLDPGRRWNREAFAFRFNTGMTDCSLCGLCLRYCSEVKKANKIYFQGRGIERKLALVEGAELSRRACGECFTLCGSGWIASRC